MKQLLILILLIVSCNTFSQSRQADTIKGKINYYNKYGNYVGHTRTINNETVAYDSLNTKIPLVLLYKKMLYTENTKKEKLNSKLD